MKSILAVLSLLLAATSLQAVATNELLEPPVFTSSNGALDILMVAKTKGITLNEFSPTAWVYEVCYRRDAIGNACPSDSRTAASYGGMRLQLLPGDHLKIRFINQLPPAPPDCEHVQGPMGEMLKDNPSNLHTHGLIVEPRQATTSNHTYGDFIYVLAYPNGKLPVMQMPGMDYTDQPLDYDIYIPSNHPAGLFWIHPHAHGLALNQISYGLAGIITVGSVNSYLTAVSMTPKPAPLSVRHLTLKDIQINADSSVLSQEDPGFCDEDVAPGDPARNGFCPGVDESGEGGNNNSGGKWFFTINGQVYPTITLATSGEVWRITQASGSRSYELVLTDDATGQIIPFQVLALDGVAVTAGGSPSAIAQATGGKLSPVACPPSPFPQPGTSVCVDSLRMMPSSRAEIYVTPTPLSTSATLSTRVYITGEDADHWPAANLAHVVLPPVVGGRLPALTVKGASTGMLSTSTGILGSPVKIDVGPNAANVALQSAPGLVSQLPGKSAKVLQEHLVSLSAPSSLPGPTCAALPAGHHRRIFFGVPADDEDAFGLGYEEVDQAGNPVPGTFKDITEFDHTAIDVCLPLTKGNKIVTESWELVNVANEDHNFHIHQTKFRTSPNPSAPTALVDNVPVPHGSDGCDGTIAAWRSGACQVKPVFAYIPFSQVGDFVYHCHILEHEDGGMMAHIRVVPNP